MGKGLTIRRRVMNFIYPRRCVFCRKILSLGAEISICQECAKNLPFCIRDKSCKRCGRPIPQGQTFCVHCREGERYFFHKMYGAYLYEPPARQAVLRFKRSRYQSYGQTFAIHMAAAVRAEHPYLDLDLVVAVPPRKERMRKTGYDQARNLAKAVAKQLQLPFRSRVLMQKEHRRKQSSLSYDERKRNVLGNIGIRKPRVVEEKRVLLVDDISTTGATLNECAKILKAAGAREVFCVVATVVGEK